MARWSRLVVVMKVVVMMVTGARGTLGVWARALAMSFDSSESADRST